MNLNLNLIVAIALGIIIGASVIAIIFSFRYAIANFIGLVLAYTWMALVVVLIPLVKLMTYTENNLSGKKGTVRGVVTFLILCFLLIVGLFILAMVTHGIKVWF